LLRSPTFFRKICTDNYGNTAFHSAVDAELPRSDLLFFGSENFGGDFGSKYVARSALQALLKDDWYSECALNIENLDGHTPLTLAIRNHIYRMMTMEQQEFVTNDGKRLHNAIDISIGTSRGDFSTAIGIILDNRHLKLDGMFDMNYNGDHDRLRDDCRFTNPQLQVLAELCQKSDGSHHVEKILSDGYGGVPGDVKAVSLCMFFKEYGASRWHFNPAVSSKESGLVLQTLFNQHSGACIKAIKKRQETLIEEANNIPTALLENEGAMRSKYKRRLYVESKFRPLQKEMDILNGDLQDFFLCKSSIQGKFSICDSIWKIISEFEGWRELPSSKSLLDKISTSKKRKRTTS
jgi:hypothetical protein